MFERIPTIMGAQEILDKAFGRASKVEISDPDRYHRIRKEENAKVTSAADTMEATLEKYARAFPNLDNLRDYDRELIDILVGYQDLKRSIGRVRGAGAAISSLKDETIRRMLKVRRDAIGFREARRHFYGRASAILEKTDDALLFLREARDRMRLLPSIHPGFPTLVIAGYPNVGKSSLLAAWTDAHPEVAQYAFTTTQANVGHFEVGEGEQTVRHQVVDTPGLLDRPDEERNGVERQAVAALRHLSDAVLFLLDPSESCGFTMEDQLALLAQVEQEMEGLPFLVAEAKSDLLTTDSDHPKFSVMTGDGVAPLREAAVGLLAQVPDLDLEPRPWENWQGPG